MSPLLSPMLAIWLNASSAWASSITNRLTEGTREAYSRISTLPPWPSSSSFLLPVLLPASLGSSVNSTISHSTLLLPSAELRPPLLRFIRPSSLPSSMSSTHWAPRSCLPSGIIVPFGAFSSAAPVVRLSSTLAVKTPSSTNFSTLPLFKLPRLMWIQSASPSGFSLQFVKKVPQKPQNWRFVCGACVGVKVLLIALWVSSG